MLRWRWRQPPPHPDAPRHVPFRSMHRSKAQICKTFQECLTWTLWTFLVFCCCRFNSSDRWTPKATAAVLSRYTQIQWKGGTTLEHCLLSFQVLRFRNVFKTEWLFLFSWLTTLTTAKQTECHNAIHSTIRALIKQPNVSSTESGSLRKISFPSFSG